MLKIKAKTLREFGRLIGEGSTREIYVLDGKTYKVENKYNGDVAECNKNEWDIYNKNKKSKFLNKVIDHNEDFTVIEVERLDCEVTDNYSWDYESRFNDIPTIFDLVKDNEDLKGKLHVTPKGLKSFCTKYGLSYEECVCGFQFGLAKDGSIKLSDYAM